VGVPWIKVGLWLLGVAGLMIVGIAIVLGPKWPESTIHIRLIEGHAITTQDVVGLVPIVTGAIWFGFGLWRYREHIKRRIRESPERAVGLALVIGLGLGLVLGTGLGAVFKPVISSLVKSFSHLMSQIATLVGLH
jgi:hypothetical protein